MGASYIRTPRKGHLSINQSWSLISALADSIACAYQVEERPEVKTLLGNLRSRSVGSAVRLADSISKTVYANPAEHFALNQLALLVKKIPLEDSSLSPEQSAWKKFLAAEHRCKRINQRFTAELKAHRERYADFRHVMRSWIRSVIGEKPLLEKIYERCDFGPGASVGVHGSATHKAAKLCADSWTSTPTALYYAASAMKGDFHLWEYLVNTGHFTCLDPHRFDEAIGSRVELCKANKVVMVPKTAMVHRTIAIEPLLNGYIQKGVDEFLRARLRRVGLDLTDQTRNQRLAKLGSLGGSNPFATIDLSSASDTISIMLVKDLLPPDWFNFLNRIRSPEYESPWGSGRYEKFTSMGNGFCFPLETLIFASIVHAAYTVTGDTDFCVYGDDIIVRQRSALLVIELLKFFGFDTNVDKTFVFGPFRESCGADYFEGVNVRPYSLDFVPKTDRDIYKIYNGVRSSPFFVPFKALEVALGFIPSEDRLLRPIDGPPDTAATVPLDVFMSSKRARWCKAIQSWTWKEYVSVSVPDNRRPPSAIQMYGLLRGQRALPVGIPEFAFRRKTRTRIRDFPSAPVTK